MPETLAQFLPLIGAALGGYVVGSVPFGAIIASLAGLGDLRKIGSGNVGATNVLRTGRKGLTAATLLLDGGKGAAAVLLGNIYGPDMAVLAGGGAFLGHLFPVWLKFKGGKGMATFLGVILAISWPAGLLCCLTWLVVAALLRSSSLATLVAALAGPFYALWLGNWQIMELAAFMAVLVFIRHHQNIRRLVTGTEPKIGAKKSA